MAEIYAFRVNFLFLQKSCFLRELCFCGFEWNILYNLYASKLVSRDREINEKLPGLL
jgi:hypothetical protein